MKKGGYWEPIEELPYGLIISALATMICLLTRQPLFCFYSLISIKRLNL
jgi:hypothetical protein